MDLRSGADAAADAAADAEPLVRSVLSFLSFNQIVGLHYPFQNGNKKSSTPGSYISTWHGQISTSKKINHLYILLFVCFDFNSLLLPRKNKHKREVIHVSGFRGGADMGTLEQYAAFSLLWGFSKHLVCSSLPDNLGLLLRWFV